MFLHKEKAIRLYEYKLLSHKKKHVAIQSEGVRVISRLRAVS